MLHSVSGLSLRTSGPFLRICLIQYLNVTDKYARKAEIGEGYLFVCLGGITSLPGFHL